MERLFELTLTSNRPMTDQVTDHLRRLIQTRRFAPGDKLPSIRVFARHWRTHVATVHAAIDRLVEEGLLVSEPRKGVFVRRRAERLTTLGIYVPGEVWHRPEQMFVRAVVAQLDALLNKTQIAHEIWVDPRPETDHTATWTALSQAAQAGAFQGLISTAADLGRLPWLQRLPVPVAYLGSDLPTSVGFQFEQFWELALGQLRAQGCRTVGYISPHRPLQTNLHDQFLALCQRHGFPVRNEWIITPKNTTESFVHERFGYERFHEFWRLPNRPEGLIVYPDSIARGVITAALELRVRLPHDLRLVIHRNAEVELVCPLPATFIESRCREVAAALIAQVEKQFRNEPCAPIQLPFHLVA